MTSLVAIGTEIGNRRRLWRRLFYWCVLPLALLYLLSNIVLNSYWMKGRVARALEVRTGHVWKVGTLNWTPNGRVHVRRVKAILGDGELTVEHLRLVPNWAKIRDRQLSFSSIEVVNPVLDISHEWLLAQVAPVHATQTEEEPDVQPPALASNEDASSAAGESSQGAEPTDSGAVASAPKVIQPTPALPGTAVNPAATATAHEDKEFYEYDAWLRVSDATLKIRHANGELVKLEGISANIPYGGVDLQGDVSCARMSLAGRTVVEDSSILLHKKGPILGLKETDLEFLGVEMEPRFQVVKGIDGLYFVGELQLPKQDLKLQVNHLDLSVKFAMQDLEARVQGAGRIDKPLSWKGIFAVQAADFRVAEGHRGSLIRFDRLFAHAQLNRGVARVPELQITGEDLSLLGNGVLTMNGRGFGVLRVITSPEKKGWIDKFCKGSEVIEGVQGALMRPLNSVDRYFMDLQIDGSLFNPMIKVDQVTDWQELWPAMGRVKKFIKDEREEEAEVPSAETLPGV